MNDPSLSNQPAALDELARAHGVHTSWLDETGTLQQVDLDSVKAVIGAVIDESVITEADVTECLADHRRFRRLQVLPPVIIARSGHLAPIELPQKVDGAILLGEDGSTLAGIVDGSTVSLDEHLPAGLYTLTVGVGPTHHIATVVSTPDPGLMAGVGPMSVGTDLAELSDRRDHDQGIGHIGLVGRLAEILARYDIDVVSSASLLPRRPIADSTHSGPMTRRGWSEWIVDLHLAPGATALGPDWSSNVDGPAGAMQRHREAVTRYSELVVDHPALRAELDRFLVSHAHVVPYARFRALGETLSEDWRRWPAPWRSGDLANAPVDERRELYHQVVQWLAETQLRDVVADMSTRQQRLEFVLDAGVHPYGYDNWRQPHLFSSRATTGRPPSRASPGGSNSLLPVARPDIARADGYRSFATAVRHQLAGGLLRIPPATTFHQLWWIPQGADPAAGTFVDQPGDEILGVVALEAHRLGAILVSSGELDDESGPNVGRQAPVAISLASLAAGVAADGRLPPLEHMLSDPQVVQRLIRARNDITAQ